MHVSLYDNHTLSGIEGQREQESVSKRAMRERDAEIVSP